MNEIKEMKYIIKDGNLSLMIAFCLIIVSTVCFYKEESIPLFIIMNVLAGLIIIAHVVVHRSLKLSVSYFIIWISLLFAVFFIYGLFILKAGVFNADKFAFMYVQCILLYYIVNQFLQNDNHVQLFAICASACAIFCMGMLYINEGQTILSHTGGRLGATLAGNQNSVGMSLGLLSLFVTRYYGKTKKKRYLLLIMLIAAFMLATGSKKALVYLLFDGIILYSYSKDKVAGFLKAVIIIGTVTYAVFCIDFFYNIIGFRIIDMLGTLGFNLKGAQYSYSTTSRLVMLNEAYRFWLENPLFGGGMNYFFAGTVTGYEYCHSNIMELLCNMGLFGCTLYYIPFFFQLFNRRKYLIYDKRNANFLRCMSVITLILGFLAVDYSSTCVSYLMAIYSFAYYEIVLRESKRKNIYHK